MYRSGSSNPSAHLIPHLISCVLQLSSKCIELPNQYIINTGTTSGENSVPKARYLRIFVGLGLGLTGVQSGEILFSLCSPINLHSRYCYNGTEHVYPRRCCPKQNISNKVFVQKLDGLNPSALHIIDPRLPASLFSFTNTIFSLPNTLNIASTYLFSRF